MIPTRTHLRILQVPAAYPNGPEVRVTSPHPIDPNYRSPSGTPLHRLIGRTGYIVGPSNQYNDSYIVRFVTTHFPDLRSNPQASLYETEETWDIHSQYLVAVPAQPA